MHTIFWIMALMSLVAIVPSALRGQGVAVVVGQKIEMKEPVA
jgi:hypothetical protein